jgi:hypothetical protein
MLPARLPEDPHGGGEAGRAGSGLRLPTPPRTVWHEVSLAPTKILGYRLIAPEYVDDDYGSNREKSLPWSGQSGAGGGGVKTCYGSS